MTRDFAQRDAILSRHGCFDMVCGLKAPQLLIAKQHQTTKPMHKSITFRTNASKPAHLMRKHATLAQLEEGTFDLRNYSIKFRVHAGLIVVIKSCSMPGGLDPWDGYKNGFSREK